MRSSNGSLGLLAGGVLALTALTVPNVASAVTAAGPQYKISYDVTSAYAVTDIAIFQFSSSENSSFLVNSFSIGTGESTINNPFPVSSIPDGDFLLGVATDLTTDADSGQQHLVLFTNDAFAASATNVAFGTLFPYSDEESLINDLEVIGQTVKGDTTTAYDDLFSFAGGDALGGPNGSVRFATGDTFTEIAFSDGQIIGTGLSSATLIGGAVSAAPEPSSWMLMIAAIGVIGAALRAGRRTIPATAA